MEFDVTQPIYKQIIEDFKKKMIRGELKKGDKILSQREYAYKATINPNTVQRAYREMENMQLVKTLRGQGTFISVSEKMLKELKQETADRLLEGFIFEMAALGFNRDEMIEMLKSKESVKSDRV